MQISSDAETFVKQANVAVLATIGPGGNPHAAPIWYIYDNGEFLFFTGENSQKCRNIERRNDVTLVVDRRTLPYYVLTVQGKAERVATPPPDARPRMAKHYLGDDRGIDYVRNNPGDGSVAFRLRPEEILEYNGEAGRE